MNIGIVTTWFERGAAYVSRAYLQALEKSHKVFIYARGGEHRAVGDPTWDLPNVTWGKAASTHTGTHVDWGDYQEWLQRNQIQLVLFNEQQNWDVILRGQKLTVLMGAYIDYYTHQTVPFFSLYDFLLCNTRRHYEVFSTHAQAIYIPWGTNTSQYRPGHKTDTQGVVRFFHSAGMGGVNFRKGTDLLVRAFQKLSGKAKLIIHSQVGMAHYGEEVEQLIHNDPRIQFIEATVSPPGLYHLGDVYVYPTRLEGIGLTIYEAMASGLPVITTNEPPMNEVIADGVNGRLIDVSRRTKRSDGYYWPEAICNIDHLVEILEGYVQSPEQIPVQAAKARQAAVAKHDWLHNASHLSQVLSEVKMARSEKSLGDVRKYSRQQELQWRLDAGFSAFQDKEYTRAVQFILSGLTRKPVIGNRGVYVVLCKSLLRAIK